MLRTRPHPAARSAARSPFAGGLAVAAVLVLASGCGSPGEQSDQPADAGSSSAAASDGGGSAPDDGGTSGGSGASDGGGADPSADAEDASASPEPLAMTPPAQKPELTSACTGEGTYIVMGEKPSDPKLPERDGLHLDVTLEDVVEHDGADLVADVDGTSTPIETMHVGDTVHIDQWTISVTSVCKDRVEFDLID